MAERIESRAVSRKFFLILAVFMLAGIIVSRGITIEHGIKTHADEHVFTYSTEVLMQSLMYGDEYKPFKVYPEGTYIFRLPFQFLGTVLAIDPVYDTNVFYMGRMSSVFYYSLGCLMALWLVVRVLQGGKAGAVIYALTVVFALFQIEQSRYGTFDPLSFFVLMLMLVLVTKYIRTLKLVWLLASAFAIGVATAGKYPLVYFFIIPMAALFMQKDSRKKKFFLFCAMGAALLLGFVLFSPSILKNPWFLATVIKGELGGYVTSGNPEGFSTIPESFFSAIVYQLFYSDLPLCTVFAVLCPVMLRRRGEMTVEKQIFTMVVPLVTAGFLFYNSLLTTFFLRTLFPYYCICIVYASAGLGMLCEKRGIRTLAAVLCTLMVIRGGYFMYVMGDNEEAFESSAAIMDEIKDEDVDSIVVLGSYFVSPELMQALPELEVETVQMEQLYDETFPGLEPGQLAVTSALENGLAKYCVFPPNKERIINITGGWENYKQSYQEYYIGCVYPEHYYRLFGFWVHGSTATTYEFRSSYVYYMPKS